MEVKQISNATAKAGNDINRAREALERNESRVEETIRTKDSRLSLYIHRCEPCRCISFVSSHSDSVVGSEVKERRNAKVHVLIWVSRLGSH